MRRFKMMVAVGVVATALSAGVASSAMAATATGTISGTAAGQTVGPCDFSIGYTGTPAAGNVLTFSGVSFAGAGVVQPCDTSTLSVSDFKATVAGSTTAGFSAALSSLTGSFWSVTSTSIPIFGTCQFRVPNGGANAITLTSSNPAAPYSVNGPYKGTGNAPAPSCLGITAALSITNLVV